MLKRIHVSTFIRQSLIPCFNYIYLLGAMWGYVKEDKDHEKGSRGILPCFHTILFCVRIYVKSTQHNPYSLMQGNAFLYNTEVIDSSSGFDYDFGEGRHSRRGKENEAEEVKERIGQCVKPEYSYIFR